MENNLSDSLEEKFYKAFGKNGMWNVPQFSNTRLNIPQRYVVWIDVMGSKNTMTNTLKNAACFVGKLHSAILKYNSIRRGNGVTIHSMTDGAFIVAPTFELARDYAIGVMRSCAYNFILDGIGFNRYVVRCAIAYGNVILNKTMQKGMKLHDSIQNAMQKAYNFNIMLGVPFVKAYMAEHYAPPYGIYIDETVRTQAIYKQTSEVAWILNRWWNPKIQEEKEFVTEFGKELLAQFTWLKKHALSNNYPIEKHEKYISAIKEYFEIDDDV